MIETADDLARLRSAFDPPDESKAMLALALIGALAMLVLVVLGLVWQAADLPVLDEPVPTSATVENVTPGP